MALKKECQMSQSVLDDELKLIDRLEIMMKKTAPGRLNERLDAEERDLEGRMERARQQFKEYCLAGLQSQNTIRQ